MAFSPDGTLLATASDDHTARIWDTATGTTRTTLHGHTGRVPGVAFSPDGTLLATASDDGTARIWDTATGATLATLVPLPDGGYAILLPDGYKLDGDPGDACGGRSSSAGSSPVNSIRTCPACAACPWTPRSSSFPATAADTSQAR